MLQSNSAIRRFLQRDDHELVRQVLGGERDAYLLLVRRHFFAVYARAYARLGARPEAAGVTREAFLETYCRLDTLTPNETFEGRVWAVARERCKHPPAGIGTEVDTDHHRRVRQAFLDLDEPARLAVLLRYGAGRPTQAIAERCGLTPKDTEERLRAALDRLGGERLKDVVAAVAPTLSPEDVARAALREAVSWHISESSTPASRRRRIGVAAALLTTAATALFLVPLFLPRTPAPEPVVLEAPSKAIAPQALAPAPAPESAPTDKTGTVEGRVLDALTDEPLSEFEVAHPADKDAQGRPVFVKTTDPEGRFYLGGLTPGPASLLVRAPGRAAAVCRLTVPGTLNEPVEVVLRLERARTVEGSVEDASGRPVAGVALFVGEIPFPFIEGREAGRSDVQGRFRAEGVPSGPATLCAYHPDYAVTSVPAPADNDALRMKLSPGGRIEGTLRADGQPLMNANVRAAAEDGSGLAVSGYTDAEGRFSLAAVPPGALSVAVDWSNTRRAVRPVTLEAGGTARVDIDFPPAAARLEGRVTQQGKTVQYAEVEARVRSATGEEFSTFVKASDEGWYRTEALPQGDARLFVMAVTADSRMRRKVAEVPVPEGGTVRQDIDFRERASLQGTLTGLEADRHARVYVLWDPLERLPLSRAQLESLTKSAVARQFLRNNGTVRIDSLEPGRYTLFAIALDDESPEDFAQVRTAVAEVTVGGKDPAIAKLDLE